MLGKLIKLGVQVVTDELEAAKKTNTKPFDWNIMITQGSRVAIAQVVVFIILSSCVWFSKPLTLPYL
ncbi:hypothetical protein QUB80_30600 [Chlorogloeopsis sp. ULAP01]|uniref:hypothetical protein n=1 Tax=Chlorogloeopsis sp. ULAP01 TaxID=3056483 RepID=UPI0025AAE40C|nr:hypothetical protein [Chlorogloeopsis sp. ULAP01]MDM9385011.1 hypothetical protein [Chlorogloeopsis sp. ULAP01]